MPPVRTGSYPANRQMGSRLAAEQRQELVVASAVAGSLLPERLVAEGQVGKPAFPGRGPAGRLPVEAPALSVGR